LIALLFSAPFPGFVWRFYSVSFSARCFFGQVRLARSHIACVALAGFGSKVDVVSSSGTDTAASDTPGSNFSGARPDLPASIFGNFAGASFLTASPAT